PPVMRLPSSTLATWPPTNTSPPAFVTSERGSARVPTLLSAKYSIVIFSTFREAGLIVCEAWNVAGWHLSPRNRHRHPRRQRAHQLIAHCSCGAGGLIDREHGTVAGAP